MYCAKKCKTELIYLLAWLSYPKKKKKRRPTQYNQKLRESLLTCSYSLRWSTIKNVPLDTVTVEEGEPQSSVSYHISEVDSNLGSMSLSSSLPLATVVWLAVRRDIQELPLL